MRRTQFRGVDGIEDMDGTYFTDITFTTKCHFSEVCARVSWCSSFEGMGFHEELHNLAAKEGLKGRKLNKAAESFAWNITVLKVMQGTGPSLLSLQGRYCVFHALLGS